MSAVAISERPGQVSAAGPVPGGRYGLRDLARAEWVKLMTVRSTIWTLAVTVVIGVGVAVLVTAETRAHWARMSPSARAGDDPVQLSLVGVFFCQLVLGVLGALVVSGEYGTGTIRATFAAAPERVRVLLAKVAVFGAVALVVGEAVSFVSFFLGQALLGAPAPHATLASPGALRAVVGTGAYLCVTGLLALALAVLLRHTAGAIGAYVGVLLVLPLVTAALPASLQRAIEPYLPSHIGNALLQLHQGPGAFSPWAGFAILCGYVAALLAAGAVLLVRRDA